MQQVQTERIPFKSEALERIKKVNVDFIVLCTTTLDEDDILCRIAKKEGINYFRGSVKDKLVRWKDAAKKFN